MNIVSANVNRFYDAAERHKRCQHKDQVIKPLLEAIPIRLPKRFSSIIMPCAHAPELQILKDARVPSQNIVAIEREGSVWKLIKDNLGLDAGHAPMDANTRMDYIQAEHPEGFDLIYLDFYGQVNHTHMELMEKIMALRMLKPGARLLLNFARGRACSEDAKFNHMVAKKAGDTVPTQIYLEAAWKLRGHRRPTFMKDHEYKSKVGRSEFTYVTTEAWF
jgi:hypothetical protein